MAEYIGLRAIGRRMGWDKNKVRRMIIKHAFQAYLFPKPRGRHFVWYTNDHLIDIWYAALVRVSRDVLLKSKTAQDMGFGPIPNESQDPVHEALDNPNEGLPPAKTECPRGIPSRCKNQH